MDANVFIAVEPFSGAIEEGMAPAARLVRAAGEQGHQLLVHPAVRDDLRQDREPHRRRQRLAALEKYSMLTEAPIPSGLTSVAGLSAPGSNDYNDLRLIAALHAGAVTHLVSEDVRLGRRAARAGLGPAVLTIAQAVALLEELAPTTSPPPPRVDEVPAYALDTEQEIFESLREDYSQFDRWLQNAQRDHENRICFVIAENREYAGLALLKLEADCAYNFPGPVLKISTLKVSDRFSGARYGELLLKAIFFRAAAGKVGSIYVEVFPWHDALIALLEEFGFEQTCESTVRESELVLCKTLVTDDSSSQLSALAYHVKHGPPGLKMSGGTWLIPIEPRWHDQLFPGWPKGEATEQLPIPGLLDPNPLPWGNALRKAYLCRSVTNQLAPGDTILFYRSRDEKAVTAVGVVESTLRTNDPVAILQFVGGRTVYSPTEIDAMCARVGSVLAILFRQDRFIEPPWSRQLLNHVGAMAAWPQTVCAVRREGISWVRHRLEGSP